MVLAELGRWYAAPDASQLHLTLAGYWYVFVSIPLFQFILVRWHFRFLLWFQFLWRVSRLDLSLISTHPDRAAGLGFLGPSTYAFSPFLFAQGTLLAGVLASRIFHDGQNLMALKMEIASYVVAFTLFVLSPLIVFGPQLACAKRQGSRDYGRLSSRYVHEFDAKWLRGGATSEELLGIGDIQSLADLGNSFAVVQDMRLVPFGLKDVARLGVATGAPLLALTLTIVSLEELVSRLIAIIF